MIPSRFTVLMYQVYTLEVFIPLIKPVTQLLELVFQHIVQDRIVLNFFTCHLPTGDHNEEYITFTGDAICNLYALSVCCRCAWVRTTPGVVSTR